MDKQIVLFIMQVWISLALWGQASICGFSIAEEDSLRYEGKPAELTKIVDKNGTTVKVTNYAASLVYVSALGRNGVFGPVVLGLDSLRYYWGRQPRLGATVGRFTNRVKNVELRLDDKIYYLDRNNKGHSIHGGIKGFNLQVFETDTHHIAEDITVVAFKYFSPDIEDGLPGSLNLPLAYKLTSDNEVTLDYIASTGKPTVINLTNHSYFSLTGCKESILNHCYMTMGDSTTPVDSTGIPAGEFMPVAGTEYDFSTLWTIRHHVEQLGKGYDINHKLNKTLDALAPAAKMTGPTSGQVLKAYTTEPRTQFHTPVSGSSYLKAVDSLRYGRYLGPYLEMQHFSDSPHHIQSPTTVLLPEETYRQTTIYKFETL